MLLTKAENTAQMSIVSIAFHVIATDPQLPPQSFFFFFLMFPKPVSQLEPLQTTTHVLSLLLGLPISHICYLQSNLEQLPHLPRESALSMTISKILCLNYSKVSMFTTYRMALSSMPSQNIGQKWAHPLEFLLHQNVCSISEEIFMFHLLQYLLYL